MTAGIEDKILVYDRQIPLRRRLLRARCDGVGPRVEALALFTFWRSDSQVARQTQLQLYLGRISMSVDVQYDADALVCRSLTRIVPGKSNLACNAMILHYAWTEATIPGQPSTIPELRIVEKSKYSRDQTSAARPQPNF